MVLVGAEWCWVVLVDAVGRWRVPVGAGGCRWCWLVPVGADCCLSKIGWLSKEFQTSLLAGAISYRLKLMARERWPENGLCFGTTPRTVAVSVPTAVLEF